MKQVHAQAREMFDRFLVEKGLRHTEQRSLIVSVFLDNERHMSVEELYAEVCMIDSSVGYATVSRTVKLLEESGVCRRVDFGDGIARYEHKFGHEHHDHLICLRCGKFVEVYDPELERLQEKLVKKHGFVQERHKLDIFGYCSKCVGRK